MVLSLLLLILVVFISAIMRPKINFNNALVILWGTWGAVILICIAGIFSLYNNLSVQTVIFIFSSLICITIGFAVGTRSKFVDAPVAINLNKLLLVFNILTLFVALAFFLTIILMGLPPALGNEIERSQYYLPNGGELLYLLIFPAYFLGLVYYKNNGSIKKIAIQLIILTTFIILKGNKMGLFTIMLMYLYLFGKKLNLFKILSLLFGIVLVFYFASFIYTSQVTDVNLLENAKINLTGFKLSRNFYYLYDVFIYLASNAYNLNTLILSGLGGIGFGTISFSGITQPLSMIIPKLSSVNDMAVSSMNLSLQIKNYNTYSGFGMLYVDFGVIISAFILFILAVLAGREYKRMQVKRSSIFQLFLGFLFYQTISLSFFTFYLGNVEVITNLIVIGVTSIFVRKYEK